MYRKRWSKDIDKMQKRYRERVKTLSVYGYYPNVESKAEALSFVMVRLRPVSVVVLERVYREVFLKNEKFQKKGGILSFFYKLFCILW